MTVFRASSELAARTLSAFILSIVTVTVLWSSIWGFTILVTLMAAAMCWEWGRAVRRQDFDAAHAAHILAVTAAIISVALGSFIALFSALIVGIIAVAAVSKSQHRILSIIGVIYIILPASALIWLRGDSVYGIHVVFFIIFVVASHDTLAMVVGKAIGGPRLWPVVSPNKTWAGVIGGLIASCCAGALFAILSGYPALLWLSGLGCILGLAGLAGDLLESAFKRHHGLRHASALIPGHGGVLDRLDGVLVAAGIAALIGGGLDWHAPAQALMLGP